jgi:hypothetical protein
LKSWLIRSGALTAAWRGGEKIENNSNKIILDLCGGTGSWSKPYRNNGYDVRVITLPDYDVFDYQPPENVYGILAAPTCTHFSCIVYNFIGAFDFNTALETTETKPKMKKTA